jgi:beta-glucanase (GH16 family)
MNLMSLKRLGLIGLAMGASAWAELPLELIWSDEFDGSDLDLSKWSYMYGNGSQYGIEDWGNQEKVYYTDRPQNIDVVGGFLLITARDEPFGGEQYTSARIRTAGKASFKYGRIEARMKLPGTSGVWPAFWMLPENSPYGGWAAGGEIDIMESVNQADRIYGTLHFGGQWPQNTSSGSSTVTGIDYSQGFHDYAIEWEPDEMRWYLDGQLYGTKTSDQWFSSAAPGNPRAPFDTEFHLLLNCAVGGRFPGLDTPDASAVFPQVFAIDYVRVYGFGREAFGGSPWMIPGTVQAEDFDAGLSEVVYSDCDAGNNGGSYRPDSDVDIQASSLGGFNVGWTCDGEFLEYTVSVQGAGEYEVTMPVASLAGGGTYRILFDGVDKTGVRFAGSTGGWQTWRDEVFTVDLDAGEQVMRLEFLDTVGLNVHSFTFTPTALPCPADLAPPAGELDIDDVLAFLNGFASGDAAVDLAMPIGTLDIDDVLAFLDSFAAGCP